MDENALAELAKLTGNGEINQDNPLQEKFNHFVIKTALDRIDAISDGLIAIQSSKYKVEAHTIEVLALLIREKIQNIKSFLEEMSEQQKSIVPKDRPSCDLPKENFLTICLDCKRVRKGEEDWQGIEEYLKDHFDLNLSHGICPDCAGKHLNT